MLVARIINSVLRRHPRERPPLGKKKCEQLEATTGVTFPLQYREYLISEGDGYNVLWHDLLPAKLALKISASYLIDSNKPFPFGTKEANAIIQKRRTEAADDTIESDDIDVHGYIILIEHGCGWQTCLVTAGEQTGYVWSGGNDSWFPLYEAHGQLAFTQWLQQHRQSQEQARLMKYAKR